MVNGERLIYNAVMLQCDNATMLKTIGHYRIVTQIYVEIWWNFLEVINRVLGELLSVEITRTLLYIIISNQA